MVTLFDPCKLEAHSRRWNLETMKHPVLRTGLLMSEFSNALPMPAPLPHLVSVSHSASTRTFSLSFSKALLALCCVIVHFIIAKSPRRMTEAYFAWTLMCKPGPEAHVCNYSTWEVVAGGSQVLGQPGLLIYKETLSQAPPKPIICTMFLCIWEKKVLSVPSSSQVGLRDQIVVLGLAARTFSFRVISPDCI